MPAAFKKVLIICAGIQGVLDDIDVAHLKEFERRFYLFMEKNYPDIVAEIEEKKALSDELKERIAKAIAAFKDEFKFIKV